MKTSGASFSLANGITVNRYTSTWTPWTQLLDTKIDAISNGTAQVIFTLSEETSIDSKRLSVYANGIQIAPSQIVISGNVVQLVNSLPEGTSVHLLYRAYQPTASDLSFDPTVSDNFQNQVWYKVDYQYTVRDVRDSSGNISGQLYYFWVTGKTIAQANQAMSLASAAQLLQYGDSNYMIFSRLVADPSAASGAGFDSCAISGLGTYITDTNSYKLRFLRDFTLRDDPQELKLKNVHTEWQLIRKHQSSSIPKQLWLALTNAICGEDAAGNSLPSQTRINYDNKYNTFTRFGFEEGQIFVDSSLAITTVLNTILNTTATIQVGAVDIVDYITFMNIDSNTTTASLQSTWFSSPAVSRVTMNKIYSSARASQINELFFNVLDDAIANNYEVADLFKTSLITVNSATIVQQQTQSEQADGFY